MSQTAETVARDGRRVGPGLTIVPLSESLGAEIRGLDLRGALDAGAIAALRDAWARYQVIVMRDQQVSAEDQRRFCGYLGEIGERARPVEAREEPPGSPEGMMYVSNVRVDGKLIGSLPNGDMQFHIDQSYTERPASGSSLFAVEVPRSGGDTMFSNLYAAYESLPDTVKRRIEGRRAVHFYDYTAMSRGALTSREGLKNFAHPVVRTHPVTGRKGLFVSRLMTGFIEGMDPAESEAILLELFDAIERPDFVYSHQWRVGDLLLWDNRCTAHARTDFDPAERRLLRRFTIKGDRPV